MAGCLSGMLECLQGPSFTASQSYARLKSEPCVMLDTEAAGSDVVIVKDGSRLCGTGAAFGNAPIVQNKAYFEVKLQQTGSWGVGLAQKGTNIDLGKAPIADSDGLWLLRHSGEITAGGSKLDEKLQAEIEEGDVIGVSFDHVDLRFYKNGEKIEPPITNARGLIHPILYVGDSAILDVRFSSFWYTPPVGFEEIMFEQSIL